MKNVFTIAGASRSVSLKKNCACGHGFTMAEILLSLTIIGVVAAITLPSLTGNINERTWNTQRKALYARFSQAIALMPSLNGYGTLTEESSSGADDGVDTAAETFITAGLSKVLKINNICDSEHLEDCGITSKITTLANTTINFPRTMRELCPAMASVSAFQADGTPIIYSALDTEAAAFETQNGESLAVYYNPSCVANMNEDHEYQMQTKICAHFIYDLNGSKGPNTMNKDIGIMTVIYPTDRVVAAPFVANKDASSESVVYSEMQKQCVAFDSEYRVPNKYELMSMFISYNLIGNLSAAYRSSDVSINKIDLSHHAWRFGMNNGNVLSTAQTDAWPVRCVKR